MTTRPPYGLVATLVAALYLLALGALPFELPDEPREAEIAREAWIDGPLHVPRLNGVPFVEKPPLAYWAASIVFSLAGRETPSETAARLPSALFSIGLALATYAIGRRMFSPRHGALAALIVAASPQVLSSGRHILTDPPLALFVTVAVGAALAALDAPAWRSAAWRLAGAGLAIGLASLAKGPIAGLMAGLALAGALVAARGPRGLVSWRALAAFAVLGACAAAALALWLSWLRRDGGEPLVRAYFDYHLGGATGERRSHIHPFWFYLLDAAPGFLPWLALLPIAFLRSREPRATGEARPRLGPLAAWVVAPLLLLSILAQKRNVYALPLYPPLALLAAAAILDPPRTGRAGAAARGLWTALRLALGPGGIAVPLAFGVVCATRGRYDLALAGVILALAGGAILARARRDASECLAPLPHPFSTVACAAIVALAFVVCLEPATFDAERSSLRPLARRVAEKIDPGTTLYGYDLSEALRGALPFELGHTVPEIHRPEDARKTLDEDPRARIVFEGADYDLAGKPGRPIAELKAGRRAIVLAGPDRP